MAGKVKEKEDTTATEPKARTPFEPGGLYRHDVVNGNNTRVMFAVMTEASVVTIDGKVISATGTLQRQGQTPLRVRSDSEELDAWTLVVRE